MGSAVSAIATAAGLGGGDPSKPARMAADVTKKFANARVNQFGDFARSAARGDLAGAARSAAGGVITNSGGAPAAANQDKVNGLLDPTVKSPNAQVDPNLAALQEKMINQANEFRGNLPGMKNQMGEQLQADSNKSLLGQQKQITNMNNKRGLLYGGINEGQKSEAAATAQGNLGSAIRNANATLDSKADELDSNAINVGVGIQQTQQQIQNNIYAQAQANIAANQSMFGSAASTGLLAYLLL